MAKFEYTSTDLEEKVLSYFAEQNGAIDASDYFMQVVSSALQGFIVQFEGISKANVLVEVDLVLAKGGAFSVSKDQVTGLIVVTK